MIGNGIIDLAGFCLALGLSINFAIEGKLNAALGWGTAAILWLKTLTGGNR